MLGILIPDHTRRQQDKGHFKDYEVIAKCIVLLIVLCFWEGGLFTPFLWPKCLLS